MSLRCRRLGSRLEYGWCIHMPGLRCLTIGVWATDNYRKDLIQGVSQVLGKDAETYNGFITKTDPHIMNWTYDTLYELGNHADALALRSTDSYMYGAWTVMGWRIKKGALYQSNHIEYLESAIGKLGTSVTQADIKRTITEAFASSRGGGNETYAPATREDIKKIIADEIGSKVSENLKRQARRSTPTLVVVASAIPAP
ncbi:unnamed protein product [Clonostachys byssicola]|uniref:Uncharacterized protein n=1 Tax=Clonostachys byssicola TaxID=160290 RepID=A0A9N9U773_9HYPO|nr:unnamed protein product [Clonostachys byssicola]